MSLHHAPTCDLLVVAADRRALYDGLARTLTEVVGGSQAAAQDLALAEKTLVSACERLVGVDVAQCTSLQVVALMVSETESKLRTLSDRMRQVAQQAQHRAWHAAWQEQGARVARLRDGCRRLGAA